MRLSAQEIYDMRWENKQFSSTCNQRLRNQSFLMPDNLYMLINSLIKD